MEQIPSNTPVMVSMPGVAGWFQVWTKVFTKPNEQTFIEITNSPDATSKTAYIWVFIAGTILGIFQTIAGAIYAAMGVPQQIPIPGFEQYTPQSAPAGDVGSVLGSLVGGICASPIAGILSILFFAIGVAIVHWIAKLFGGVGSYEKLAYAFGAISLPLTLVTSVLSLLGAIPFVGICTSVVFIGLSVFAIYLQMAAVKAVNRFGWGQAIGSMLIPLFVILFICGCVVIGVFVYLGPRISDVFGLIN